MISTQYAIKKRNFSLKNTDDVPWFDASVLTLSAVRGLDILPLHPRVTFFVGENGLGQVDLAGGHGCCRAALMRKGNQELPLGTRTSHSDLHAYLRIVKGIRRPKMRVSCEPRVS